MLNMTLYRQMGFSQSQVKRAHQYAQSQKIDIFDALQILQKQPAVVQSSIRSVQKNPAQVPREQSSENFGSVSFPFKNINLSKYEVLYSKKRMSSASRRMDIREQLSPVGLLNVHNCCYLNSLLQCYFLSSDLVKYIFEAVPLTSLSELQAKEGLVKIKRIKNEYNLLHTLKDIFARMCLTSRKHIDPTEVLRNLVNSVGEKVEYGDQKDLFETNVQIIQRLNQCLLYTKKYYKPDLSKELESDITKTDLLSVASVSSCKSVINKSKINERDSIKRLFYGKKIEYTDPINDGDPIQEIVSDFLGIIINPAHENLYKALDEEFHYQVELEGPGKSKPYKTIKHTYIREVPQYLYFYINRTGYNAQEKQALKNEQKLSFDFVIHLDRYLEIYKQEASVNAPIIMDLLKKKNELRKRKHNFQIFARKLEECRTHSALLQGWSEKLPKEEQIALENNKISKQLIDLESQLQKVESRKEQYYLMYIFAHRGDAVSGHYWGYGRNQQNWYRFDINTKKMKEQQILLDLYKSGGTPYALVYVKKKQLPQINYTYYRDFQSIVSINDKSSSLIEMDLDFSNKISENEKQDFSSEYFKNIPTGLSKVIISENIQMHLDVNKKKDIQITAKILQEYVTRTSMLQSEEKSKNYEGQKSIFKQLPSYQNYALYLWTIKEYDLAKFNVFALSLKIASSSINSNREQMTTKQLIKNEPLLENIQKQFRKKIKGNVKILKHFCIYCQPKEKKRYFDFFEKFLAEREMLKFLNQVLNIIVNLNEPKSPNKQSKQSMIDNINKLLTDIAKCKVQYQSNNSYVKFILNELCSVFLLKIINEKLNITIASNVLDILASDKLKAQLLILSPNQNQLCIKLNEKDTSIQANSSDDQPIKEELIQKIWKLEDIGKGMNSALLEKNLSQALTRLKLQITIFKRLEKENKFSKINKDGEVIPHNNNEQQKQVIQKQKEQKEQNANANEQKVQQTEDLI